MSDPLILPRRGRFPRWLIVPLALAALGVAVVAYLQLRPLDAPIPEGAGAEYAGLAQGFTDEGYARLGNPAAPVTVEEFSSYACPHCRDLHDEIFPGVLPEIADGDVQWIFIPNDRIGWGAREATKAALCAGQQGAYWAMHDVLFDWQRRFAASTFAERRLVKGVENLGLDGRAFETCLHSGAADEVADRACEEFKRRGLTGTPTLFVNGQRVEDYAELDGLHDRAASLREGAS